MSENKRSGPASKATRKRAPKTKAPLDATVDAQPVETETSPSGASVASSDLIAVEPPAERVPLVPPPPVSADTPPREALPTASAPRESILPRRDNDRGGRDRDRNREPRDNRDNRDARNRDDRPERGNRNDNRDNRDNNRPPQNQERAPESKGDARWKPTDEYAIQTYFDKAARHFVVSCVEFPEVKSTSSTREGALKDFESKLESHINNVKRRGEKLPEPVFQRQYPERLEIKVSQGLYRRLDILSRQEKVPLDHLLGELLTAAVEKRLEPPPRPEQQPRPQQRQEERRPQRGNERHGGGGQQQHRGGGQQRSGGRSRNYHETMDNRENFLEYVRSLEKGNWRKK